MIMKNNSKEEMLKLIHEGRSLAKHIRACTVFPNEDFDNWEADILDELADTVEKLKEELDNYEALCESRERFQ